MEQQLRLPMERREETTSTVIDIPLTKELAKSNLAMQTVFNITQKLSGQLAMELRGGEGRRGRGGDSRNSRNTTIATTTNTAPAVNQDKVNHLLMRISNGNYLAALGNFLRTRKMETTVSKGKLYILSLSKTIATLETSISHLNQEVESQKREASRIEGTLTETRSLLKRAILQYRKELDEQKLLIQKQGKQIQSLSRNRLKVDMLIDTGLLVLVLVLVRKTIYTTLLKRLSKLFPKKNQQVILSSLEFITLLSLFLKSRSLAYMWGLHGHSDYLSFLHPPEKEFQITRAKKV